VNGAILAGGAGRRMGGVSKATLEIDSRPLAAIVAEALAQVCERVAIVCKRDTELPRLPGIERWDEPDEPRHPLTGIVNALERAGGPVLVCAVDMPWVTADACRSLIEAAPGSSAAVAVAGGIACPVFGVYAPAAAEALREAPPDAPLRGIVERLDPARVALPPSVLRSVNTPADLVADTGRLAYRALTRAFVRAYNARDVEGLVALCDSEIELHAAFAAVSPVVFRGHGGVRAWHQELADGFEGDIQLEPKGYAEAGDSTLIDYVLRARGPHSGAKVSMPAATVARWKGHRIAYLKTYLDRAEALEHLGLGEDALEPFSA
jgi:molybdopterin-guanine dinucleotide biosynthesis protein A